ncbi:hypothetical protein ACFXDI_09765 [Streptomyces mirabilis]|uniref:hypothetical protein n=1 Tax=Streptomyces mirabilis TaxID=68239 RepID=UPI003691326D
MNSGYSEGSSAASTPPLSSRKPARLRQHRLLLQCGRIPELPEPDALEKEEGSRGRARKKWRRASVAAAACQRGVLPAADQDENEDLVGAAEAARILGLQQRTASSAHSGTGSCPISNSPTGSNTVAAVPADCASSAGDAPASRS